MIFSNQIKNLVYENGIIKIDLYDSSKFPTVLKKISRIIQANNEIRVSWQHAECELFAWTIRAVHATNRFVGSPFNTDIVAFVYTNNKLILRLHINTTHAKRSYVHSMHYNRLRADCLRIKRLNFKIVLFSIYAVRWGNKHVWSSVLVCCGGGIWCEPETNITKNNRKTNVYL